MFDLRAFFRTKFGLSPACLVQAPGRLELLGNHTDYNNGLVMALAVDQYLQIASSRRTDGQIELVSTAFEETSKFPHDRIEKNTGPPWANYIKGVLFQLRGRGVNFTGFTAAIHSAIPVGAGMASSAALQVATALAVRKLFPYSLTESGCTTPPRPDSKGELPPLQRKEKWLLAKLCLQAETEFVGVNCGLLDQISCLFGKASHVIQIDCGQLSVQHAPMPPGIAVVVCDSGVQHDLTSGEYNARRRQCESAARALGVKSLRSVTAKELEANQQKLSLRDYQCAGHIVSENQRVSFGERALRDGDSDQFGQYLFQSHESSRDFFQNSCAELDLLVELARGHPGCVGARLTGGGFGGATINLVREPEVKNFIRRIAGQYEGRTGRKLEPLVCRVVNGVD